MTEVLKTAPPLNHAYNLACLGKAGDLVRFEADADQREAVAALSGVLSLASFAIRVTLTKVSPTRFVMDYRVEAEVIQACVVTLELVPSRIDRHFIRELHFVGNLRRPTILEAVILDPVVPDADEPEEIISLHYDLAAPALEEYLLALDPYPRKAGVEFSPNEMDTQKPESPFAALKSLKSST